MISDIFLHFEENFLTKAVLCSNFVHEIVIVVL